MTTIVSDEPSSADTPAEENPYLVIEDLKVRFKTEDGIVKAVDGLSFELNRGKTLGIVGESGSGKSVTSLTILGLHNPDNTTVSGSIRVGDVDVVTASAETVRRMRGRNMAMIFQDPLTALHPFYPVGRQIMEAYRVHHNVSRSVAAKRAVEMLDRVGIPEPHKRAKQHPHEFSGGMRQRAMIAMGLVNNPELIIADEPTTALDVTVQAQILDLLNDLQREFNSAIVLITHDLGVVSQVADDVLVMYGGRAVEYGTAESVLRRSHHPYAWGLLNSIPTLHGDPNQELVPIPGNPPSLLNVPSGCSFHPRCAYAMLGDGPCATQRPELLPIAGAPGHFAACHLPETERMAIRRTDVERVETT